LSVSDKSQVVREVDSCDPAASLYAPAWRAAGWNGTDNVYRVEVRARDAGLRRKALDLTDPANLSAANIGALFSFGVHRFQLLDAAGNVDPRWRVVQEAAGAVADLGPIVAPPPTLAAPERIRRAEARVRMEAARLVATSMEEGEAQDVIDVAEFFTAHAAAVALAKARSETR
jgi:hypothetical protein